MKKVLGTLLAIIIAWCAGCENTSGGDGSPVVPLPSPPIARGLPIVVDFDEMPDGPVEQTTLASGVEVDGEDVEVLEGEAIITSGRLEVTSPLDFLQAAVLVRDLSGYPGTTIEGLDEGGELLTLTTKVGDEYYYVQLLGPDDIIRRVQIRADNAEVKKLIFAKPFNIVDFEAGAAIPSTWRVSRIAITDFDGDSISDVLLADSTAGQLMVLLGEGKGVFSDPIVLSTLSPAVDVIAEDVDGDGLADIAALGEEIAIFLNTGGEFALIGYYATQPNSYDMAMGDFDGDTLPDIAIASGTGLHLVINEGSGIFGAPQLIVGGDARSVDVGDMNGDSFQDIIVAKTSPSEVEVFLGDGSGGFVSAGTNSLLSAPISLSLAKFDWDDHLDVTVLMAGSPNWQSYINDGLGILSPSQAFQATFGAAGAFAMADINNDGFADMAVVDSDNNELAVFTSDVTGNFTIAKRIDFGGSPIALAAGDMNEDGRVDLIYGNNSGEVLIYENASTYLAEKTAPLR